MFDLAVFSSFWPKGLLLSKRLAEQGLKVCYVDCQQEEPSPFGLFLGEFELEQKAFLQSVGKLTQQEEGFSLLSSQGCWSFQETEHQILKPYFSCSPEDGFNKRWLKCLSQNLMSCVFEGNDFSLNKKGQDFFSNYYLFRLVQKKKKQFAESLPNIQFEQAPLNQIRYSPEEQAFFVNKTLLKSKSFFWFVDSYDLFSVFSSQMSSRKRPATPHWQWTSFAFEGEVTDYASVIPSHFVSLHQLSWPWTHSNLLSVFCDNLSWEVWARQPYGQSNPDLETSIQTHLNQLFKGAVFFQPVSQKKKRSFLVYSKEALNQKKNPFSFLPKNVLIPKECAFLTGDLVGHLKQEIQWAESKEWMHD